TTMEMSMSIQPETAPARGLDDEKRLAHVLYILHALAPFTADAAIAAFLAALVRETGLPLSGAPDARHP
ncbi:hypothetical protein, partial [Albidovulum sp.]|uniref:hypothetical protein n=1 Tax=Albidovulum sp. TaxID=1872424 RepID=UPI0039B95ADA